MTTNNSKRIMVTWEKVPLKEQSLVPDISETVKTVLLQQFLMVFNYSGKTPENQIFAFDLKEKQWLQIRFNGDDLNLKYESSVSLYDNNTIVIFGASGDGKEDILNVLTFDKGTEVIHVYNDATRLQDSLGKTHHSANIFGEQMYIYGGNTNQASSDQLSILDLETLKIIPYCLTSGQAPGKLYKHSSISKGDKAFLFGGLFSTNDSPNPNIYILDSKTLNWTMIQPSPKRHCTVQIHEDNIYLFGGSKGDSSNSLSIYNLSKNSAYEIARKGNIPPASYDSFSAIYENKLFIIGGTVNKNYYYSQATDQIYSFSLDIKPVNGFIKKVTLRRALGPEEDCRDWEALEKVQQMLKENKEHDIVFRVQGKEIPAHKRILSFRSSYFSNMFSSGMQESHCKEITLSDISPQAFQALLEYMYKGSLPSGEGILKELIIYSEQMLVKRLRIHCERTLINQITKENAAEFYELSKRSGAEDLREATLQLMGNNLSYFVDYFTSALPDSEC